MRAPRRGVRGYVVRYRTPAGRKNSGTCWGEQVDARIARLQRAGCSDIAWRHPGETVWCQVKNIETRESVGG